MLRKIQKKFILPIKWAFERKKIVADLIVRPPEEIYKKIEDSRAELIIAQRLNNTNEVIRLKSVVDTLTWVTYDRTKREGN